MNRKGENTNYQNPNQNRKTKPENHKYNKYIAHSHRSLPKINKYMKENNKNLL